MDFILPKRIKDRYHNYELQKMNNKILLNSIFVITAFLFAVYGKRLISLFFEVTFDSTLINLIFTYSWQIVPIIIAIGILYRFNNILTVLCLDKNVLYGFIFSLLTVSPMLISSVVIGEIDNELSILQLLRKTLFAGFFEEVLFRGFLFGILFRKLGWGFIPASAIGAIIFGFGHLYQGTSVPEMIGIFSVTFVGSAWFAWLFIEWDENLWIPIFLHVLMNLSWTLFNVSDNALGDIYVNVFRAITIAITVFATIRFAKKRGGFLINKGNLFRNIQID